MRGDCAVSWRVNSLLDDSQWCCKSKRSHHPLSLRRGTSIQKKGRVKVLHSVKRYLRCDGTHNAPPATVALDTRHVGMSSVAWQGCLSASLIYFTFVLFSCGMYTGPFTRRNPPPYDWPRCKEYFQRVMPLTKLCSKALYDEHTSCHESSDKRTCRFQKPYEHVGVELRAATTGRHAMNHAACSNVVYRNTAGTF